MIPRTTGATDQRVLYTRRALSCLALWSSRCPCFALIDYLSRAVANARRRRHERTVYAYNVDAGIIALLFQLFLSRGLLSRMGCSF